MILDFTGKYSAVTLAVNASKNPSNQELSPIKLSYRDIFVLFLGQTYCSDSTKGVNRKYIMFIS